MDADGEMCIFRKQKRNVMETMGPERPPACLGVGVR